MNPTIVLILVVLALISFLLATIDAKAPASRPINWVGAGLTLVTLAWLVSR